MSTSTLSLLDSLREESSFLPPIMFGYLYTKRNSLPICDEVIGIPFIGKLAPESDWLLGLTIASLLTGAGVYTIAMTEMSASSIRGSTGRIFGRFLDVIVVTDWIFTFLAPLFLAVRVCQGDLVVNSLLFIWAAIFLTTIWSYLLYIFTDVEGFKGFSK